MAHVTRFGWWLVASSQTARKMPTASIDQAEEIPAD